MLEYISSIRKTKDGHGVIVFGKPNASADDLSGELSQLVEEFYQTIGLTVDIGNSHRIKNKTLMYVYPKKGVVYNDLGALLSEHDIASQEIKSGRDNNGKQIQTQLKLIKLKPEYGRPRYVAGWDFPHLPEEVLFNTLLLYFNKFAGTTHEREITGAVERDKFFKYACRQLAPPKTQESYAQTWAR